MTREEKVQQVVTLRAIEAKIGGLITALLADIEADDVAFLKLLDAVRAEQQGAVVAPALTHEYAPPQHIAPFCSEDDPPSRPA